MTQLEELTKEFTDEMLAYQLETTLNGPATLFAKELIRRGYKVHVSFIEGVPDLRFEEFSGLVHNVATKQPQFLLDITKTTRLTGRQ